MWKWEAEGEAKAVIVIVHGAMEHHRRYGWLIEMFRLSGFHVVMGDLPGQGMTTRSSRGHIDSFSEYTIEIKDWIQAAYQFDLPVFLVAHSLGGLASIRLLQQEKLKIAGVILSSPCLGLKKYPPKLLSAISILLNKVAPRLRMNTGLTIDMATRNAEIREIDSNDTLYITKVSVRWYRELIISMAAAFANANKMQDLPLLVMQGGDDSVVDKKMVKNWFNMVPLSEKRYKEWPQCFHEIFNEPERDEVFDYALDFIRSQLKSIGYIV
ncbi:alpha/beta hydrolase [Niallia taxi]|uniref:Alpha/beta hydrolase n=1 Tax=Niallia taxi TaxID=2499688 RepID=A0A3S3SL88_9BACI|nr:alpha/beta hydrolase [Niallia taxi]MDK8639310.1 alpha/beta hydrolase [Niallia taxi]MED4036526.1 alpha/beta hydrolase [Niallia taxi]MED4053010.1 alpha/beta hydrolase [Niallia taxi]MED4118150.1 alpha/beta hydrolase [Niallia taxi]RVT64894.1 alpha/beta hydrolase [Niallia taxi]